MTYLTQQQCDADGVLTSAPPLGDIPGSFDPEKTWTGGEESELDAIRRRAAFFERRAENAEARERSLAFSAVVLRALADLVDGAPSAAEHRLARGIEIARRAGVDTSAAEASWRTVRDAIDVRTVEHLRELVTRGLAVVPIDDLLAEIERRGVHRPVSASTVPVARDDAGDHATQDLAK